MHFVGLRCITVGN